MLQAFFPERPVPPAIGARRFVRLPPPPHPATTAQPRAGSQKPPHPATVAPSTAQPRAAAGARPPHPAASAQPRSAGKLPPHPATVPPSRKGISTPDKHVPQTRPAQPKGPDVHAFQPPAGFLEEPRSDGQPLPGALKKQMERYFETDFSDVRLYVGPEAASIGALAFTIGSDIYVAPEHYQPATRYGQELLGHELTHVLQQRDGRVANPFGDGVAVVQDEELEAEADQCGREAAEGRITRRAAERGRAKAHGSGDRAQLKSGYRLVLGTYLHQDPMPEPLAGHSFVAIEEPGGGREAWGFSPAEFSRYDPHKDVGKLRAGVPGRVHDDTGAFDKPGVKTHAYSITEAQAKAAKAKVQEYQSGRYSFSLDQRQCATFALDVMRAAELPVPQDGDAPTPRVMYQAIDRDR